MQCALLECFLPLRCERAECVSVAMLDLLPGTNCL